MRTRTWLLSVTAATTLALGFFLAVENWRTFQEWRALGPYATIIGKWVEHDNPNNLVVLHFFSDDNSQDGLSFFIETSHGARHEFRRRNGTIVIGNKQPSTYTASFPERNTLLLQHLQDEIPTIQYRRLPRNHPLKHFDSRLVGFWVQESELQHSGAATAISDMSTHLHFADTGEYSEPNDPHGRRRGRFTADGSTLSRIDRQKVGDESKLPYFLQNDQLHITTAFFDYTFASVTREAFDSSQEGSVSGE